MEKSGLVKLFCIGAVIGTIFDGFHTFSNTTIYTPQLFLKMAWWTPLYFGTITTGIALGKIQSDRQFHRKVFLRSWLTVIGAISFFGLLYFSTGFAPVNSLVKCIILALGLFALWYKLDGTPIGLVLSILTGFVGCIIEEFLIYIKAFHYVQPEILGMAWWLPLLYAAGGMTIGVLADKVLELKPHSSEKISDKRTA